MSFHKKCNLSIRSKRRRVEEELKSIPLSYLSSSKDTQNLPSTSNYNLNLDGCTFMPLSNAVIDIPIPEQTFKTNFNSDTNFDVQNNKNISFDTDISGNNLSSLDESSYSILLNNGIKSDQVFVSLIGEWVNKKQNKSYCS